MLDEYLSYSALETTHDDYEFNKNIWGIINELRQGAASILRNLDFYLPKKQDETGGDYRDRQKMFAYTPVMSTAVKDTAARLGSAPVYINYEEALMPALNYLREHNDAKGKRDERTLIQELFLELLYFGRVYVVADRKAPDVEPLSVADETNLHLPYLNVISALNMTDWDDDGEWFKMREIVTIKTPQSKGYALRYTFFLPGMVQVFEAPIILKGGNIVQIWDGKQFVRPETKTLRLKSTVVAHGASTCLVSHEVLPHELWVGLLCYLKQIQHLRIESSWTDAGNLAGTIQRVFTPTPAVNNDNPSYLTEEPEYDKVELGNRRVLVGGNFQFVESQGVAIRNLTDQMKVIEQQIKDIVSMKFAAGQANYSQASGVAMAIDQTQLINTMKDYGSRVRGLYQDALQTLMMMLGLPTESLSVAGLSDFTIDNIKDGLLDAVSVAGLAEFIPMTAQKLYWQKITKLLTGTVSPEDDFKILSESEVIFALKQAELDAQYQTEANPTLSDPNTEEQVQ
jgi:hypothetical protein